VDTNFINFSIQNKIELVQGMMDCLMAKCELSWPGYIRLSFG
jgi:U3 small nucleolar RNA-associated protein 24